MERKRECAVLAVSFGTSHQKTRGKTLDAIEKDLREAFADYEFRRAYTSPTVIRILKERDGMQVEDVEEALKRLLRDGFRKVLVQTTHVIHGFEYDRMQKILAKYRDAFERLVCGEPLLTTEEDYREAVEILGLELARQRRPDTALVLIGHGTEHAASVSYAKLQQMFWQEGFPDVFIGTVEASANLENIAALIRQRQARRVVLAPFLVAAGKHVCQDMAGEGKDSWKSRLLNEGFQVECVMTGLGEYAKIRQMYVRHAREAADGEPAGREKKRIVYVVGIGPGGGEQMTGQARRVLEESDSIVGYTVYVDLLRDLLPDKEYLATPMRREEERCRMAFDKARKGKRVAMVCSGDAGVYGMAGLMLELGEEYPDCQVEIVPGVTAALAGGALLGAPLTHDFAVISLSDLLTPWEKIEKRLRYAAAADLSICIYNPSSKNRAGYLQRACDIILEEVEKERICGLAFQIGREGERWEVLTLEELRKRQVDMFTTVFIGNSQTRKTGQKMVTPRGYRITGETV